MEESRVFEEPQVTTYDREELDVKVARTQDNNFSDPASDV